MSQTVMIILIVLLVLILDLVVILVFVRKTLEKKKQGMNALQKIFQAGEDWEKLRKGKPVLLNHQGRGFICRYGRGGKNSPPDFTLTLSEVKWPAVGIQKENAVHRFSKRIGLTAEMETGDRVFDENYYIDTDDISFYRYLFADSDRRKTVHELLTISAPPIRQIRAGKDGVGIRITPFHLKSDVEFQPGPYLDCLLRLVEGMENPSAYMPHEDLKGTGFLLRTIALYVLAGVALIIGAVSLGLGFSRYTPLEEGFLLNGLMYTLPFVPLFWYLAFLGLRGKSWSHRVFYPLVLIILIGGILLGLGGMVYTNGRWDQSAAVDHACTLTDKYITKNKNSRNYWMVVKSWHHPDESVRIEVGAKFYSLLEPAMKVRITTRSGYWKQEWIESFAALEAPSERP